MVVQYESQRHAFVMIEHKIDGVNFMRFKGREYIYLEPSDLNNTMKIGEYLDKSWDFKKFEVLIYN